MYVLWISESKRNVEEIMRYGIVYRLEAAVKTQTRKEALSHKFPKGPPNVPFSQNITLITILQNNYIGAHIDKLRY